MGHPRDGAPFYFRFPAKAGTHPPTGRAAEQWVPAFDGMTICNGAANA